MQNCINNAKICTENLNEKKEWFWNLIMIYVFILIEKCIKQTKCISIRFLVLYIL